MCKFFSFDTDGKGKFFYFNAEQRAALRESNPNNYGPDSHTSIAAFHGFKAVDEDKFNKWEYSPLTKDLVADQINTKNDKKIVRKWLDQLDFKTIVPELIVKPIIHPFTIQRNGAVSDIEIELLKTWASVRASVWDSVGPSVRASVRASVWDSVGDSVRASVWDSVWDSVGDSVRAYISSFFQLQSWKYTKHAPGENPFQSCIDLWEAGLVPSFDGKTWRLHAGPKADIVYEWKP